MMGWLGGWQYRKSHVINSASGAGTNYQVRIKVHYGSGTDSGEDVYLNSHCRTDFGDVRFTDDDGVTLLDYWMEEKSDSDYAVFWIEIADDLSSANATIYIYYGKSDATTTSNGDNTFILFDNFNDGNYDGWVLFNKGAHGGTEETWDASNYYLESSGGSSDLWHTIKYNTNLASDSNIAIRFKFNVVSGDYVACFWDINGTKWFNFLDINDPDVTKYHLRYDNGTTETKVVENYQISPDVSQNTWYRYETRINDGTFKFYLDDVLKHTSSGNSRFSGLKVGLGLYANGTVRFDDFLVRKYVDPEPSHGSWGSEETAGGQTYEVNVDAVVQSHATITKETMFNVEKDASVSGQSLTAQEVGFNVVRDALVQASVAMQVLGVYPFNVEALVGASADAQFRQTLGISRDAAVAVVSAPLFQSMFNVGSDAVLRVVAEAGVVKEGEVKVTRVFLVLGDLAIQLTGD